MREDPRKVEFFDERHGFTIDSGTANDEAFGFASVAGGLKIDDTATDLAVALAVATERPDSVVTACDVSWDALAVARRNGGRVAPGRVEFLQSDLFAALTGRRFDWIAANLPYVAENEYAALDPTVRDYEPKLALTSGADGLDLVRRAVHEAWQFLTPEGKIMLELSPGQALTVAELLASSLRYCAIEVVRDFAGRDRFVAARVRVQPGF